MKLTWFGGTTLRVHIGGQIVVVDAEGAPSGIDASELVSGAELSLGFDSPALPAIDPLHWLPPRPSALLDEAPHRLELARMGDGMLMLLGTGEAPLVLAAGMPQPAGRWARDAVIVAFSGLVAEAALMQWGPRLIALAIDADAADAVFGRLAPQLGETGLMLLEAGLALEV